VAENDRQGVDMVVVRNEELEPQAFLDLAKKDPSAIKSAQVKAARLGSKDFGKIVVVYSVQRLRKR
jgi:hypothetical protein